MLAPVLWRGYMSWPPAAIRGGFLDAAPLTPGAPVRGPCMTLIDVARALLLGIIEGFTEFLPVSSTGHLLLVGHFIGFESTGFAFEILVQLGAILAILMVYAQKLIVVALALPHDQRSRRFVLGVLLAFLPAAIIGAFSHSFIKTVLFNPMIVCTTLISGGLILLAVDSVKFRPKHRDVMDYPLGMCVKIGFFQCLAMAPGVSRSGATIVGSMLLGADKRSSAEYSFFLAMPTMAGAFAYDLYKNYNILDFNDVATISIGFVAAFLSALVVVRGFLQFVSSHGFALFAYWRIIVGTLGWIGLYFWPV